MEHKIIREFCRSGDTAPLQRLSPNAKTLLVDGCFSALFQKYGNQDLAIAALEELGEVQRLSLLANEAEGRANHKKAHGLNETTARKAWKDLSKKDRLQYRQPTAGLVYTGPRNLEGYNSLQRMGATVVKVLDEKEIPDARTAFVEAARTYPEYKRDPNNPDQTPDGHPMVYVLGGFAAFGNPASFHTPYVRRMRERLRQAVLPLFEIAASRIYDPDIRSKIRLETLIDRSMYRHKSQAPSAESWHRDVTPAKYLTAGDEVYGGWLNLDTQDQYLSFVPGSHLGVNPMELREGFAALSPEAVHQVKSYATKFAVPPGHILVFPQYALHEVVSTKAKHDMIRIFSGWRTTVSEDFLMPDLPDRLRMQAPISLPSGQKPPIYSANHASFFKKKAFKPIPDDADWKVSTIGWSTETFKEAGPTGVPITVRHEKVGVPYSLVPRYMASLYHYGLPMYPAYTQEEIDSYRPTLLGQQN